MTLSQQLEMIVRELSYVQYEGILMLGALVLLIVGLVNANVWLIKTVFGAIILMAFLQNLEQPPDGFILNKSLQPHGHAQLFNALFCFSAFMLLIYRRSAKHALEFYFFILSILIGASFLMKSNSLLVFYLAIELISFASYILTVFGFKKSGFESGLKYLLYGALSSAISLFGIGLLYGLTGTLFLNEIQLANQDSIYFSTSLVLVLIGVFFKASIFPLHIWVPATYQSAPSDATAFMAIVPKLSAIVFLFMLYQNELIVTNSLVDRSVLSLGIATLLIGTLGAINQRNARRMISFGSIAHSGFILAFTGLMPDQTIFGLWYYAATYALMNLAVFYLIDHYERTDIFFIEEYRRLRSIIVPISLTVVLVSLIGIPPVAGFLAKLFLFLSLYESYQLSDNNLHLVYLLTGLFATVISLFFYLKIPYHLFFKKDENHRELKFENGVNLAATLFSVALLLLFFVPELLTYIKYWINE
jgi:NADH-quinone oxidoreductase subunit N